MCEDVLALQGLGTECVKVSIQGCVKVTIARFEMFNTT